MAEEGQEKDPKENDKGKKKKRSWWKRGLRILGRVVLVLFIVLVVLILFIRSPWGQNIIVGKLTQYISDKTHTEFTVDKLYLTFSAKLDLEGVYLADQQGDTLFYSKELKAAVPVWPLITGEPISINRVQWKGVRANVVRHDTIHGFNYQFLIDAFASDSTEQDTTESTPPEIALGNIDFSDFKIRYIDEVTGMKSKVDLGQLHLEGKELDLENMKFGVKDFSIANTEITYKQTKALPETPADDTVEAEAAEDTTASALPFLSIDQLALKNVHLHYQSVPDGIDADLKLGDFLLQVPQVDLNQQVVQIKQIALQQSDITVKMKPMITSEDASQKEPREKEVPSTKTPDFTWPDWEVHIASLDLKKDHLQYQSGPVSDSLSGFDPNHIDIGGFTLEAKDIALSKDEKTHLNLSRFAFRESSGFDLKQLGFVLDMDKQKLAVSHFNLKTGHSDLSAQLQLHYPSIQQLIETPEDSRFKVDLTHFSLGLQDAFLFQPDLADNAVIEKLSRKKITGNIEAEGSLAKMQLPEFLVHWGPDTKIETHGHFAHITDPDSLRLAVDHFEFKTTRSDVTSLIPEEDLGISVPETVELTSQIRGSLKDITTQTVLAIPEGGVQLSGHYQDRGKPVFKARIAVDDLNVGQLLQNPEIGNIDLTLRAAGEGSTLNDLVAQFHTKVNTLELGGYDYSALKLQGQINRGKGDLGANYKDYNLNLNLHSNFTIDSTTQKIALDFALNGADLYNLGWMDKKIKTKLLLTAQFVNRQGDMDVESHIRQGVVVYKDQVYQLGKVNLEALLHQDSTAARISSNFLNGRFSSNANIDSLTKAIGRQFNRYFADSVKPLPPDHQPVLAHLNMNFIPNDLMTHVFVPDLKEMDTLKLGLRFNQKKNDLVAYLNLPHLNYADNTIDSLGFQLNSTVDAGRFIFGFKKLDAGAFVLHPTFFNGHLDDGVLTLNFNALGKNNQQLYLTKTQVSKEDGKLKIHINPEGLILNAKKWQIPDDNALWIQKDKIKTRDFVLSRHQQQIEIADDLADSNRDNIGIAFHNFRLSNVLGLLNPEQYLADGKLQGKVIAFNPFGELGLQADLKIDSLEALQTPLGDLALQANSENGEHYNFEMDLKGEDLNLALQGDYSAGEEPDFDIGLHINKLGLKTVQGLSGKNLTEAEGYLSGKVTAHGPVSAPHYKGFLQFNDAGFRVAQLNAKFYFNDDKIVFNQDRVLFDDFSIDDENHHPFVINGKIDTRDLSDPGFDLHLHAKDFQVMNSTEKDNPDYYGVMNFDLNGSLTGAMSFPKVNLTIGVNKNTDFTYVLSASQAALQKRDGVVEFVNKEHPEAIMTRTSDSANVAKITGMQLRAKINVDKQAQFGVILDPQTGNNLKIAGEGALIFRIAKNGHMSLTGRYTVSGGYFQLNLYHLVKRKFDFKPGSTVSWSGDPMGAALDFTAIYKIKTAASGLMAAQLAGMTEEEQEKYKQVLPFDVLMTVRGTINKPELSFGLEMPEAAKGAIGGTVYARIRQLNEDVGELNKQVFSLLVLNKFYPESGSDGSGGGVAGIARDNLNKALSDQLNSFADKLMGDTGVQLNFGLNSYTDYQGKSPQERTDLNITAQKKLFNDRLVVKAGSDVNVQGNTRPGEENPLIGNVSIEYLMTKDGRWRLRGFRKTEYENVIDGQVFVNGIGVVFQRQFNHFRELWRSFFGNPAEEKKKKTLENKADKKNNSVSTKTQTHKNKSADE